MSVSVHRVVRHVKRAGFEVSHVWRDAMSISGKWVYVGLKILEAYADPVTIGEIRESLPAGVYLCAVRRMKKVDGIVVFLQISLDDDEVDKCVTY